MPATETRVQGLPRATKLRWIWAGEKQLIRAGNMNYELCDHQRQGQFLKTSLYL